MEAALTLRKRVDITYGITETLDYPSMADKAHIDDMETW